MAELIPISIREVEARRDAILDRALRIQLDQPVEIDRLVISILSALPAGISYDTLFESVRYLAGRRLDLVEATRVAWRIAGNIPQLKAGNPMPPWTVQRQDEWVPLQILRINKTRNAKDVIGFDVTTRAMAGSAAPLKLTSFWSIRVVKLVASKIGFSRPWHKYKFSDAQDLVGLRFYGLVEAARSRGKPEFHEVDCTETVKKWNRDNVLKLRLRVGVPCPAGYTHACRVCALGYDRCAAATHPKTYTLGFCAGCGTNDVPFDPDSASPHCIECATAARIRKKT